jgi:hypothetical protein
MTSHFIHVGHFHVRLELSMSRATQRGQPSLARPQITLLSIAYVPYDQRVDVPSPSPSYPSHTIFGSTYRPQLL